MTLLYLGIGCLLLVPVVGVVALRRLSDLADESGIRPMEIRVGKRFFGTNRRRRWLRVTRLTAAAGLLLLAAWAFQRI